MGFVALSNLSFALLNKCKHFPFEHPPRSNEKNLVLEWRYLRLSYSYTNADLKISLCLCSYKNNTLKMSHSQPQEFSSYLPVKFVNVNFLTIRLFFNIVYCFCVFLNTYLTCTYIKK